MIRPRSAAQVYGRSRGAVRSLDAFSSGLDAVTGDVTSTTFGRGAAGSPLPSVSMATCVVIVAPTAALTGPGVLLAGRRSLVRKDDALASRVTS